MYRRAIVKPSRGYRHTLSEMRRLVDSGRRSPSVVARARELTRHLEDRDVGAEVHTVHDFVRDNVRYTNDPWGVETLTDPRDMLREVDMAGRASEDCDSHVVLEASLLESLGHPTRFQVAAMDPGRPGDPSHVYLETRVAGEWVPLDPIIKNRDAGWIAPAIAGRYGSTLGQDDDDVLEEVGEEIGKFGNALHYMIGIGLAWLGWKYVLRPLTGR